MATPVRSYVLIILLGFLVIKLGFAGMLLVSNRTTRPWGAWESRTALAGDEQKEADQSTAEYPLPGQSSPSPSEVPDLAGLREGIAALESQLKTINADIDRYFRHAAGLTGISPKTLEEKRLRIEKEKRELKQERERLDALKQEISENLAKLTKVQSEVRAKLDERQAIREERIKHLIQVYTTMPPKKAAALIDKLEMEIIVSLFSRMKGDAVGQILPYVSPEKAAGISERLATLRQ
jgi:flagellar motility protein MotE (MotC chaperone)